MSRPANPRPIQPVRPSEAIIALAIIVAMALLIAVGYELGRMQRRRIARSRIRSRQVNKRINSRQVSGHRRNLRLVKRR